MIISDIRILFLLLLVSILIVSVKTKNSFKYINLQKSLLDSFPFIIFTFNSNMKILYKNKLAKDFLKEAVLKNIVLHNKTLDLFKIKQYKYIPKLYLNNAKTRYLECAIFLNNDGNWYCIGSPKLNNEGESSEQRLTSLIQIFDSYMSKTTLSIDIETVLKFTAKVLHSNCACFYKKISDTELKLTSLWKENVDYPHDIGAIISYDEYKPYIVDYPYYILYQDNIKNPVLKNRWVTTNVVAKIIAPIFYKNDVYGIISFSIYNPDLIKTVDKNIIQLISNIVNFILTIHLNLEQSEQTRKEVKEMHTALLKFMEIENQASQQLYDREIRNFKQLKQMKVASK